MSRVALALCFLVLLGCRSTPVEPAAPPLEFERTHATVEALLSVSAHRAAQGNLAGALSATDSALRHSPRSGVALLARAEYLALSGSPTELAEAEEILAEIAASNPEAPGLSKVRATTALASGDPDLAWDTIRDELDTTSDPEVRALAAEILLTEGDELGAIEQADHALDEDSTNGRALAARAAAQLRLGDDASAERDARQGLRARRDDAALRLLLAETQLRRGKTRSAKATVAALPASERSVRSERLAGSIALASGDPEEAREAFERALALDPGDTETLHALAELDLAEYEPGAALERLAGDTSPEGAMLRARALLIDERPDEARADLRALLRAEPELLEPWGMLLATTDDEGTPEERARTAWGPDSEDDTLPGVDVLTALLHSEDDTERAAARYDAALARDPDLTIATNNRASLLLDAGQDAGRALTLAESAYATSGAEPVVADTLGHALLVGGQSDEALRVLSRGLAEAEPRSELARILRARRARALHATGDDEAALAAAEALLAEHRATVRAAEKAEEPEPPDPLWLADARAVHDALAPPEPEESEAEDVDVDVDEADAAEPPSETDEAAPAAEDDAPSESTPNDEPAAPPAAAPDGEPGDSAGDESDEAETDSGADDV